LGQGFFPILRFPLPILIPPNAPQSSSSIIRGCYNRRNSGRRTSGISLTPPKDIIKKKTHKFPFSFPWRAVFACFVLCSLTEYQNSSTNPNYPSVSARKASNTD
jgi:hypothetical protein